MTVTRQSTHSGRWMRRLLLPGVAVVVLVLAGLVLHGQRSSSLVCAGTTFRVASHAHTGHQRAERVTFSPDGQRLAVLCPRYDRLVLFEITPDETLTLKQDVALRGRPVSTAVASDRIYVLERPAGDARHIESAWWETFDFEGHPIGPAYRVGFDPDDLVLLDEGRTAVVLLSGNAEGETNRPPPSAVVFDLSHPEQPRRRGEVGFDQPRDDPERLIAIEHQPSADTPLHAAVSLRGSNTVADLDLSDLDHPRIVARLAFPGPASPGALATRSAGGLWVASDDGSSLWALSLDSGQPARRWADQVGTCLEMTSAKDRKLLLALSERRSALVVFDPDGHQLGLLKLGGLIGVRPLDLASAASPSGARRIAICDRSGGVHLVHSSP